MCRISADITSSPRLQTAEKKKWLARLSLLSGGGSGVPVSTAADSKGSYNSNSSYNSSYTNSESNSYNVQTEAKFAKLVQDDENALQASVGKEKYLYLEYLEWMGYNMLLPGMML